MNEIGALLLPFPLTGPAHPEAADGTVGRWCLSTIINAAAARDAQHDFEFTIGSWQVQLRRLLIPLTGSTEWSSTWSLYWANAK